jgi:hypothetical protein
MNAISSLAAILAETKRTTEHPNTLDYVLRGVP